MKHALSTVCAALALGMPPGSAAAQTPLDAGAGEVRTEVPRKAAPDAGGIKPGQHTASAFWYDGGVRRALRVDPAWIADFATAPTAASAKSRSPLKRSIGGKKALETLPAGASPVFRDTAGSPRALPGGVIVRLRDADRQQARERLAAAGLVPVRAIDPQERSWLVESPPGLPSLELANRLHEGGEFESAEPNWWRPRTLK
ncbi:MAG: hypothetical protein EHM83_01980 [Burkholderiales bacterium]|nr:MAG: hypothetical protein EHM83_01980 [Burkholderiales bacterium]